MTPIEADRFITDPLPDPKEELLVEAEWLQKQLRELHTLRNENNYLKKVRDVHMNDLALLKHRLMVSESNQPYRRIIDTKA